MRATASRQSASSSSPSASSPAARRHGRASARAAGPRLERAGDVPARHPVGEGVVVDVLVVLVRPDHVADVARPSASSPARDAQNRAVSSRISAPASQEEVVVAGRAPVLPDRVGDVGADVVLHPAGQDVDQLAVGRDHALRRGLLAGVGRFPGVERALVAERAALARAPGSVWKRYISSARAASGQTACRRAA